MKKIRYIPYGYTMRNGRTVISTEEAEIIREIFKAYLDGASLKAIAEELTGRQIPYTQRTTTWDKARIARIIDNAKYIGTEEYAPIIDEDMYEAAVSLKTARQRNTCEKENDAIDLLRDFVRCDNCGQPMKRRVSMKHRIRESWNCTNDDCGIRVRISDTQLIETITVLINRVILNDHLLQPKPRKRYEPDAKVTKVGNDIALELERDAPNEEYIIEKTIEMAALMYEQSNAKLNLTVSLARKLAHTMVTQDEFNRDYFTALASYITLGEQGRVVLHSRYALTDVLICGNCGTRYRRVTWSRNGVKRIVWRCISRLDYGKKYCSDSPTIMEDKLQEAIVRAVNKFNEQDNATYKALMRATISEALGLNGDPEEVDMLERKVEALNNKMLALVNESVSSGDGIEAHESEFMTLSQETELLKQRIAAIQESTAKDNGEQSRLEQIQAIISERENKCMEYDDSIVRQMVECIKAYPGGKLEIIFGGGYLVEESV